MDLRSPETQIFLVGCFSFVVILYALGMGMMTTKTLPGGYSNPVLALELVEKDGDIAIIKSATDVEGNKAGDFIQKQLKKDVGFIILYMILFSSLSLLLLPTARWAAYAGVSCSVVAGIFDFIENRGMDKALRATEVAAGNNLANSIRYPSLTKWALIFVVSIIIGTFFLAGRGFFRLHTLSFAWLLVLSGIIGLTGVALNLLKVQSARAFLFATLLGVLSIIGIAFLFTFATASVMEDLYPQVIVSRV